LDLKLIENGIIPVYENNAREKLVDARKLFVFLRGDDTKTKFVDWIKDKIDKYGFEENVDFTSFSQKNEKPIGGRPSIEYKIVYERNSKNGVKGDIREQGYKIDNICYKIIIK